MPHWPNQFKILIYLLHSPSTKDFITCHCNCQASATCETAKKNTNQVFWSQALALRTMLITKVSQVIARSHTYAKLMRKGGSIKILSRLTEFSFAGSLLDFSRLEEAVNAPSVWQFSL